MSRSQSKYFFVLGGVESPYEREKRSYSKSDSISQSFRIFLKEHFIGKIVAVDVCGECAADDPEAFSSYGFEAGNLINRSIISVFS